MNYTHVNLFFILEDERRIYLHKKDVSHKLPRMKHLHLKLNGFGGGIEESDENEYAAARREINEELEIDLDKFKVIKQGEYTTAAGVVVTFKAKCNLRNYNLLKEEMIKHEGEAKWYDFDYVLNHPQESPEGYILLYESLFNGDENFKFDFTNYC